MGEQASSQSGGLGGEARSRRGEGDLLAERRARRAAESGEHALMLRAEAAEARVREFEAVQEHLRFLWEENVRDVADDPTGVDLEAVEAAGRALGRDLWLFVATDPRITDFERKRLLSLSDDNERTF